MQGLANTRAWWLYISRLICSVWYQLDFFIYQPIIYYQFIIYYFHGECNLGSVLDIYLTNCDSSELCNIRGMLF